MPIDIVGAGGADGDLNVVQWSERCGWRARWFVTQSERPGRAIAQQREYLELDANVRRHRRRADRTAAGQCSTVSGSSDAVGTIAADSGLVSSATWTPSAPLTPTSKYTWTARSEYQGLNGPWSAAATFTTPVAPGNDYGAWESACQGRVGEALVVCVWNFVRPTNSVQDLEVTKARGLAASWLWTADCF